MIIPDINLLLYAYDTRSPFHGPAASWWSACMSGTETIGLPHVVVFGFLRIATSARVFEHPMTPNEATEHIRSWLSQPGVALLTPGPRHVDDVLGSLSALGTAGNMVTDAQIATLAIENRAVLHTADADFLRFPRLHWHNPLTGLRSPSAQ